MTTLIQDLRFALRLLRKELSWSVVAILTLALGIGATLAIFTLVDHALLRSLPYPEPERLTRLFQEDLQEQGERESVSPANFVDWRENESFEAIAAFVPYNLTLSGDWGAERVLGAEISAEFFSILRTVPSLGRFFTATSNEPGSDKVVVVSRELFERRFGADPALIGQSIRIDGEAHTVLGVLPPGFYFPVNGAFSESADLWRPIILGARQLQSRGAQYLRLIGRLGQGTSLAAARAEMDLIAERLREEYPDHQVGVIVEPVTESRSRLVSQPLLMLLGAVAFLLLIACANVSHLLLARARERRRELALRLALGATRQQIVRQLLSEAALLAALGAGLGLLAAGWMIDLFASMAPDAVPQLVAAQIDGRILLATLGLTILTVGLSGLVPAWLVSRDDLARQLGAGVVGADPERQRFGRLLIVAEVALALILITGAGLMVNSLLRLLDVDPGFRTTDVLSLRLGISEARYAEVHQTAAFYDTLLERVRALPGVESASAVGWLPLGGLWNCSVAIEGRPEPPVGQKGPWGLFRPVATDYFRTLDIPLRRGRVFEPGDSTAGAPVIVINEAFAQRFFDSEDPLGRKMQFECAGDEEPFRSIIGVVGNVRQFGLEEEELPGYYIPYSQLQWNDASLVVRLPSGTETEPLVAAIRAEVHELDPEVALYEIETLDERLADSLAQPRFLGFLLGAFALIALVMGAAGVYGVLSYAVARRRREMSIRAALGARAADLVRKVISEGMFLVVIGIVLGLFAARGASRLLEGLLYGVESGDPRTFVLAAGILSLAALVACWVPARRTSRVDVMRILRED